MAENKLSDARVRSAAHARDGSYLSDGGGLRIRLLPPSRNHPKGARLAEFHYKAKDAEGAYRNHALHLGTVGEPFTDPSGQVRPFTLADARRARNEARELVAKGIDPREAQRLAEAEAIEAQRLRLAELDGRRTVKQAFERWHALYLTAHRKDGGEFVQAMFDRHILPAIGDKPLETLQRRDVADLLDSITAQGIRRTANMVLSLLRQFVRWCAVRDWIERDPTLNLSKAAVGGKDKPRERTLSQLEIVALRDALPLSGLPERMQRALWVILSTGCRVGELSGAKVVDFDLKAQTWLIPETKNGSEHLVHLSAFAIGHIKSMAELSKGSAYLLPGRTSDEDENDRPISDKVLTKLTGDRQRDKPLKGRTKASGALLLSRGRWTPHDLRRTMATMMRGELRISSDVVERCLNHKPQGIVGVYQTGELMAERKEAFEAWGAELERLMKLDATNIVELGARAAGKAAA
jgi:integrase